MAQRDVWFGLEALFKRQGDVRLTDARFAGEHHRAALTSLGKLPPPQQQLEFLVAPNERCQSGLVLSFEAAFHSGSSQHLPRVNWSLPSLKNDRTEIAVVEMSIGQAVRTFGDQHCAGFGKRLQTRS